MSKVKINPEQLEIKLEHRKPAGMTPDYAERVEEIVFRAYYQGQDIGHATVDRYVKPTPEESLDSFFTDQRFNPPRSIPWVFYMKISDEFQGQGIATAILRAANEHYKQKHDIPLYSTTCNPKPTKENLFFGSEPLWEALVRDGLAEEIEYQGKRRWRFL